MNISASMVKELRERTGAGMMECKKALSDVNGDMDAAADLLRKKGAASADKKAGRIAAEGVISSFINDNNKLGTLVEVNCETDFVAKEDSFRDFADKIAGCIARHSPATVDDLLTLPLDDESPTVDAVRRELVGKVGEKIDIRRFQLLKASGNGTISCYLHGVRIGVLVSSTGGPPQLGRDIAMHVAASKPVCTNTSEVPEDVLAKEREIYLAQARESGKPEDIVEKMVSGRLRKFVNEISLVAQPFVKQPDQTVADLLQSQGASVEQFVRFEVGEGIQKRDPDDFVAEVLAQAKGD